LALSYCRHSGNPSSGAACWHSLRGMAGLLPVVSVRVTGRVFFVSVNQVLVRLWACCQGGVVHDRFLRSREV